MNLYLEKENFSKQEMERSLFEFKNLIAKLEQELQCKERENKLNNKKSVEMDREMQKMREQKVQMEKRLSAKPAGTLNSHNKIVAGLKSELIAVKAYLHSYQIQLELSKQVEKVTVLKASETKENQHVVKSVDNTDTAKVIHLRQSVKKLKSTIKKMKEAAPSGGSPESKAGDDYEDDFEDLDLGALNDDESDINSSVSSVTSSSQEKVIALEQIILSMQQKLLDADDMHSQLKIVKQERDVLLEFIQVISASTIILTFTRPTLLWLIGKRVLCSRRVRLIII